LLLLGVNDEELSRTCPVVVTCGEGEKEARTTGREGTQEVNPDNLNFLALVLEIGGRFRLLKARQIGIQVPVHASTPKSGGS